MMGSVLLIFLVFCAVLCCVFLIFFLGGWGPSSFCDLYQMLLVSLDCLLLIAPSVFSHFYLILIWVFKEKHIDEWDAKRKKNKNTNKQKYKGKIIIIILNKVTVYINIRENRKRDQEWTIQKHKHHWVQDTERRPMVASRLYHTT